MHAPICLLQPLKMGTIIFNTSLNCFPLKTLAPQTDARIYIIGDSHCLSPGWDVIEIEHHHYMIQPVLITGCKLWHLRDGSLIHAKVNYQEALHTIPDGSTLIYIFGEIDCREGILPSIEKGRYPHAEAAMEFLLKVYMDRGQRSYPR